MCLSLECKTLTGSVKYVICFAFYYSDDLMSDESKSQSLTLAVARFESVQHVDLRTLQCNLFLTSGVIL